MFMPTLFGEDLFDSFFEDFARPAKRVIRYNAPVQQLMKTDVKENEAGYELAIDLPGYKKENVQAELKDGYMTIQASMNESKDEQDENGAYIRRERYSGSCSRSFYVGEDVTQEDIKAKFEDGILKIFVPKVETKPAVEEKKYIAIEG